MSAEQHEASNVTTAADGVLDAIPATDQEPRRDSVPVERQLLSWALGSFGNVPVAFVLWDGSRVTAPGVLPRCHVHVHDRAALWRLISYPEHQLAELYAQGRIHFEEDLERVLEVAQQVRRDIDGESRSLRLLTNLFRPRPGSLRRAKDNIQSHYDVGNDFYKLWLDENLVYTCAYFPTPEATLEQAQMAKLELVCRKLRLRRGERVVEAGCGWGALALYMARNFGVRVRAYNISRAQLEVARERAERERLGTRVEFVEGDYREISGDYDAFVSVGMLEHVGPKQYPELGTVMNRCLPPNGRGLIHTIGTDIAGPMNTWIERRIFPGAYIPSLEQMMPLFVLNGFSVLDVENLRLHYALTLQHWLQRFEAARDEVLAMFDAAFLRTWRFYLLSSRTAFNAGHLQLYQVLFARRGCNEIPWTRSDLYRDSGL